MKIRIVAAICLWLGMSLNAMGIAEPMEVENKVDKAAWAEALKMHDIQKVEELLKMGADPNTSYDENRYVTPLATMLPEPFRSKTVYLPLMDLLLRYGADPNAPVDKWGNVALDFFVMRGRNGVRPWGSDLSEKHKSQFFAGVKLLFQYGADPYQKNRNGFSSMHYAKTEKAYALITLFAAEVEKRWLKAERIALCATLTKGPLQLSRNIAKIIVGYRYPFSKDNNR